LKLRSVGAYRRRLVIVLFGSLFLFLGLRLFLLGGGLATDDFWLGGYEEGLKGSRQRGKKALVGAAIEVRGHGSGRLRLQALGNYPIVVASYLELAEPSIADGARYCVAGGAGRVIFLPYFLAAGVHVKRDLSAIREQLSREFPKVEFVLAEALGPHTLLDRIVLERASEAERQGSVEQRAKTSSASST